MSDKVLIPKPHELLVEANGVLRYRPAFTSLSIEPARDNGRALTVNEDGHLITFLLSAEQAKGLARLLTDEVAA